MAEVGERQPASEPSAAVRTVLVDAHVHCHPSFDLGQFLDHAQRNFSRAAVDLAAPGEVVGVLALTAGRGEASFERFRRHRGDSLPRACWRIVETTERQSLVARCGSGIQLALVAGQQIRLQGGLELLAIGVDPGLKDGGTLDATAAAIRRAGALPVLPWGFGKWTLRRGRLVDRLLNRTPPDELLVADSGTRAALSRYPPLLTRAESLGFRVIAGSDPLPLAGEVARPGSFGFLVPGPFSIARPAASVKKLLGPGAPKPRLYGAGRPLAAFLRAQLAMQLGKRRT